MTILNPSKGVMRTFTFADMKGGTRERRGWVFEGEKGPRDKGRGTLIKSIFPLAVLQGIEKGKKWTDKRGCYGGQPGKVGWGMVCRLSSTVFLTGNCEKL